MMAVAYLLDERFFVLIWWEGSGLAFEKFLASMDGNELRP